MSLLASLVKTQKVVALSPASTIFEGCQLMAQNNIGSVMVMEKDQLVGIFTERDLVNRVAAKGLDYKGTPLSNVMTQNVATVSLEESLQGCFQKMEKTRCRRLPIVEGGKVVGMVTMRNLLEWLNREMEEENVQMKRYIQS